MTLYDAVNHWLASQLSAAETLVSTAKQMVDLDSCEYTRGQLAYALSNRSAIRHLSATIPVEFADTVISDELTGRMKAARKAADKRTRKRRDIKRIIRSVNSDGSFDCGEVG